MISWEILYDIKNKYVGLSTILYFKQRLNSNKEAKFLDYSLKLDFFGPTQEKIPTWVAWPECCGNLILGVISHLWVHEKLAQKSFKKSLLTECRRAAVWHFYR